MKYRHAMIPLRTTKNIAMITSIKAHNGRLKNEVWCESFLLTMSKNMIRERKQRE